MKVMKALADLVLVIFPFEAPLYQRAGVDVRFVGHPLLDLTAPGADVMTLDREFGLDRARPTVALLPGSRPNELLRIAPVLASAAEQIALRVPGVQFIVARAPHLDDDLFAPLAAPARRVVEGRTDDVLSVSDVVLTASGTATVQTAIHGKPMVVLYKLSPLTYRLGKPLAQVDMYAMVNLIAGRRIVRELIQDACTPEAVADEAVSLLTDRQKRDTMVRDLEAVKAALGGPGASARAAGAILDFLRGRAR
jgi:lipid-A-disaccharide synthase